jgi:DcmR-like sensory protein
MYIQTSDQEKLEMGFGNYTCNWGLHICGLYETEKERDDILFGFLERGFLDGDYQLYCPSERSREDFIKKFSNYCPHCHDKTQDPEYLALLSAKELYYPDGNFSPKAMDDSLNSFFEQSQQNGERKIRATAEMVWALDAIKGVEDLMVYESRLNYFIPGKPWVSICMYNVTKFSGQAIMQVLKTHPFSISGGIIAKNPYYIDPDKWLADNAPEFLNI